MSVDFVVTGGAGALGSALAKRIHARGDTLRTFDRRPPRAALPGVEHQLGDLADRADVERALTGARRVIHAGATMVGAWADHLAGTVKGTENVVAACKTLGVEHLVHISSMSVVDWAGSDGRTVDEGTALEPRAEERGFYTQAKLAAERAVTRAAEDGLPVVILRPGQIFGGGIPLVTGAVARRVAGRWIVLGDGELELPLVYIDDVVDAVLAAADSPLVGGEIIHVVDDVRLAQNDVLARVGGAVLHVPRAVLFGLGGVSELPLALVGRTSPIARYRLKSALARLHYRSDRARTLLGWTPRVGVVEGIRLQS